MSRTVLDDLPPDLAFLAPAARAMLAFRAGLKPGAGSKELPGRMADEELDQIEKLLYAALKKRFPKDDAATFNRQVIAFGDSLWNWLNAYRGDRNNPETALLFTIVGTIPRKKEKTWFQRAGSALGTAYGRLTRPSGP